ncbi:MAG: PadR family transcriptional regulator [Acidimicrobiales bacterium]
MLELAMLGLLGEQELHGYEIRKRLRDELGFFSNVSFGSLYPALNRLERAGAITSSEEGPSSAAAAPTPMTGSLSGERAALRARRATTGRGRRGRKVYRITEEGRRQFTELLDSERDAGDDARNFGLRLAFARYLPPQARLRLLERRRSLLLERLAEARAAATSGRCRDPYAMAVVEHTADSVERDLNWVERLIAAELARTAGRSDVYGAAGGGSTATAAAGAFHSGAARPEPAHLDTAHPDIPPTDLHSLVRTEGTH